MIVNTIILAEFTGFEGKECNGGDKQLQNIRAGGNALNYVV